MDDLRTAADRIDIVIPQAAPFIFNMLSMWGCGLGDLLLDDTEQQRIPGAASNEVFETVPVFPPGVG